MFKKKKKKTGFTLIETMISITLFSAVMTIAIGALMIIIDASKKAKTIQSVVNNLNIVIEGMSREIRVGYDYSCGISSFAGITPGGRCRVDTSYNSFGFHTKEVDGKALYKLHNEAIYRWIDERNAPSSRNDGGWLKITADEITVTNLSFRVAGTGSGDSYQPRVMIIVNGYSSIGKFTTDFNIQTTVSQRRLAP